MSLRLGSGIALLAIVSAALLTLPSPTARAQAGARIIDMTTSRDRGPIALDDAGRVWYVEDSSTTPLATVPGAVALAGSDYGYSTIHVACANGDIYALPQGGAPYYVKNVLSGAPTPTTQQSWGQVKERYR